MFCVKLLFLLSFFTFLVEFECQDYEGEPGAMPRFPDVSCHPVTSEYVEDLGVDIQNMFHSCVNEPESLGTPFPHTEMSDLDEPWDWSTCPKICMLSSMDLVDMFSIFSEETQKYRRQYEFKNQSWNFEQWFGEELSITLATKVYVECQGKLEKIFEIERSCKDPVALELYDCVSNAVAC